MEKPQALEIWEDILKLNGENYFRLALVKELLDDVSYDMVFQASSEDLSVHSNKHHSNIVDELMRISKVIENISNEVKNTCNYNPDHLGKRNPEFESQKFSLGEIQAQIETSKGLLRGVSNTFNNVKPLNKERAEKLSEMNSFLEKLSEESV